MNKQEYEALSPEEQEQYRQMILQKKYGGVMPQPQPQPQYAQPQYASPQPQYSNPKQYPDGQYAGSQQYVQYGVPQGFTNQNPSDFTPSEYRAPESARISQAQYDEYGRPVSAAPMMFDAQNQEYNQSEFSQQDYQNMYGQRPNGFYDANDPSDSNQFGMQQPPQEPKTPVISTIFGVLAFLCGLVSIASVVAPFVLGTLLFSTKLIIFPAAIGVIFGIIALIGGMKASKKSKAFIATLPEGSNIKKKGGAPTILGFIGILFSLLGVAGNIYLFGVDAIIPDIFGSSQEQQAQNTSNTNTSSVSDITSTFVGTWKIVQAETNGQTFDEQTIESQSATKPAQMILTEAGTAEIIFQNATLFSGKWAANDTTECQFAATGSTQPLMTGTLSGNSMTMTVPAGGDHKEIKLTLRKVSKDTTGINSNANANSNSNTNANTNANTSGNVNTNTNTTNTNTNAGSGGNANSGGVFADL